MSIEGAVGALHGVDSVTVNIEPRTVDVRFVSELPVADIVDAIESQGYEVIGV